MPILLMAGTLVFVLALSAQPQRPDYVTAIFPPWWSQAQAFDAASNVGGVTGFGNAPYVVNVWSDDEDLSTRLHRAGAVLVVDPGFAGLCERTLDSRDV